MNTQRSNLLGEPGEFDQIASGSDGFALGTGDNSDSGSDVLGAYSREQLESSADSHATGERSTVELDPLAEGADIAPDAIQRAGAPEVALDADEVDDLVNDLGDDTPPA